MACRRGIIIALLLLLCPLPQARGQTYNTTLQGTKIAHSQPLGKAKSSCHCKVMCAVQLDCLAATFDDSDSMCHISTGPQTSITTTNLTSGTSWFKFDYTPPSPGPSSPPTVFLSRPIVTTGTVANMNAACAAGGGIPADLKTQGEKDAALALVRGLALQLTITSNKRWAWLIATDSNSDGAFEWSDGTPVTSTVFRQEDFTGNGPSAMLRNDGKIELVSRLTMYLYPVVCITK